MPNPHDPETENRKQGYLAALKLLEDQKLPPEKAAEIRALINGSSNLAMQQEFAERLIRLFSDKNLILDAVRLRGSLQGDSKQSAMITPEERMAFEAKFNAAFKANGSATQQTVVNNNVEIEQSSVKDEGRVTVSSIEVHGVKIPPDASLRERVILEAAIHDTEAKMNEAIFLDVKVDEYNQTEDSKEQEVMREANSLIRSIKMSYVAIAKKNVLENVTLTLSDPQDYKLAQSSKDEMFKLINLVAQVNRLPESYKAVHGRTTLRGRSRLLSKQGPAKHTKEIDILVKTVNDIHQDPHLTKKEKIEKIQAKIYEHLYQQLPSKLITEQAMTNNYVKGTDNQPQLTAFKNEVNNNPNDSHYVRMLALTLLANNPPEHMKPIVTGIEVPQKNIAVYGALQTGKKLVDTPEEIDTVKNQRKPSRP